MNGLKSIGDQKLEVPGQEDRMTRFEEALARAMKAVEIRPETTAKLLALVDAIGQWHGVQPSPEKLRLMRRKRGRPGRAPWFLLVLLPLLAIRFATAQGGAELHITVVDPTGALIRGAHVELSKDGSVRVARPASAGVYVFPEVPFGHYRLEVQSAGFSKYVEDDVVMGGASSSRSIRLSIEIARQQVAVSDDQNGLSTDAAENANATVLKGSDLDALSDDPSELQNELHALAGPGAGPNGGEIYIDGFTGGQLPARRSIREIRVNENPFSAEYDKIGYGRIEIFTNPSSGPLHGHFLMSGNDSAWNTANPLVQEEPSYYSYFMQGSVSRAISKTSSFLISGLDVHRANQSVIDAVNPSDPGVRYTGLYPNPSNFFYLNPRIDVKIGTTQTLSIDDSFYDASNHGQGVGGLQLQDQALDSEYKENAIEFHHSIALNAHIANEVRVRWRRLRNSQVPQSLEPTVTVQGAFVTGGNASGTIQDRQDLVELDDDVTHSFGKQLLRFGVRGRLYRDTNYANSGANSAYIFDSTSTYLTKTPAQYQVTEINNPTVKATIFDGAGFIQDEWAVRPNLSIGLGLRLEGQNHMSDSVDPAPRVAVSWAPRARSRAASTVLHAGYGWFYNRFIGPSSLNQTAGTPYLIQALHYNGANQQSAVVTDPPFYDPTAAVPLSAFPPGISAIPIRYSLSPELHTALDMQAAIGIDQELGKKITVSATYINTRGIHQYLSNSIGAPAFDTSTYSVIGARPTSYNYQYESGGIYRQNQLVVTLNGRAKKVSTHVVYTLNDAKTDTQGVAYFPSVAASPRLDYGRASFAVRNQLLATATYSAPYGFLIGGYLAAQSGTPFNITIGEDLTENNQFNARPTFGACGAPGVAATPYGCLDTAPLGKREQIIPYNLGTGPSNVIFNLRVSKRVSFPMHNLTAHMRAPGVHNTRPRYSLTFTANASNLFNIVNFAPPNGTLLSPLFGTSQALASGQYSTSSPGNRTISLQTFFNF